MDYYQILGISREANEKDVKAAFRKIALKYHPDRHSYASPQVKADVAQKFKAATEAYETLVDGKAPKWSEKLRAAFQNMQSAAHILALQANAEQSTLPEEEGAPPPVDLMIQAHTAIRDTPPKHQSERLFEHMDTSERRSTQVARVSGPSEDPEPQKEALGLPQHLPASSKASLEPVPRGTEEGPRAQNVTALDSVGPPGFSSSMRGSDEQSETNPVSEEMQATDGRCLEEPADQSESRALGETERVGRQQSLDSSAPASQAEPGSQVSGLASGERLPKGADTEAALSSGGSK